MFKSNRLSKLLLQMSSIYNSARVSKGTLFSPEDTTMLEYLYDVNNQRRPLCFNGGGYFTISRATVLSVSGNVKEVISHFSSYFFIWCALNMTHHKQYFSRNLFLFSRF